MPAGRDTGAEGTADADAEPEAPIGAAGNADVAAGPPGNDTLPIGAAGTIMPGKGADQPYTQTAQVAQQPADPGADNAQGHEEAGNSETHTVTDAMSTEPEDEELCPNGVPASIRFSRPPNLKGKEKKMGPQTGVAREGGRAFGPAPFSLGCWLSMRLLVAGSAFSGRGRSSEEGGPGLRPGPLFFGLLAQYASSGWWLSV